MSRASSSVRVVGVSALLTLLVALSWGFVVPASAGAQASDVPAMSLAVSDTESELAFRTLAVSIDPAGVGLAALSATVTYDAERVIVTSCAVSEVGACNVDTTASEVLVSVFNLGGIKANDQLLTLSFEPADNGTGMAEFELAVDTALDFNSLPVGDIEPSTLLVPVAEPRYGSLTGDVYASDTQAGLFGLDVCVARAESAPTCTTTSGLGSWRLDDLIAGEYIVTVEDPAAIYATLQLAAQLNPDTVSVAADAVLEFATDDANQNLDTADPTEGADTTSADVPTAPLPVVVYEASIAGQIVSLRTGLPLEAIQVCATQPLVLHQSCGTTDDDGQFGLLGLSSGNYWVTTTDPTNQFDDGVPKLVGVVGNQADQRGVRIRLTPLDN